jgi:hypothetical protein
MITGSEAINKIKESFVRDVDMESIAEHCKHTGTNGLAISFREAGADTLEKLNKGAAAKGHNILEKSIKEKSMGNNFKNIPSQIRGLIGHWVPKTKGVEDELDGEKDSRLEGIYVTQHYNDNNNKNTISTWAPKVKFITLKQTVGAGAKDEITVDDFIKSLDKDPAKYVSDGASKLNNLKKLATFIENNESGVVFVHKENKKTKIDNIYHCFYTGDYDLHDIINFNSQQTDKSGKGVRFNSVDFATVTNLAKAIADGSGYGRKITREFNVIRHGPQCGYYYYCSNRFEHLIVALLQADLPIAMCNKGIWSIIGMGKELEEEEKFKEIEDFYYKYVEGGINGIWEAKKRVIKPECAEKADNYLDALESYQIKLESYDAKIKSFKDHGGEKNVQEEIRNVKKEIQDFQNKIKKLQESKKDEEV